MKLIPQKFLEALSRLINQKDNKAAERVAEQLETEPDRTVERIVHHIGSQTGPIKFK